MYAHERIHVLDKREKLNLSLDYSHIGNIKSSLEAKRAPVVCSIITYWILTLCQKLCWAPGIQCSPPYGNSCIIRNANTRIRDVWAEMVAIATEIGERTKEERGEGSGGGCLLRKSGLSWVLKDVKGSLDSHRAEMGETLKSWILRAHLQGKEGVWEKPRWARWEVGIVDPRSVLLTTWS